MIPFPDKKFSVLYADPPWAYSDKASAGKRGACHKYAVMSMQDICALPVADIAAEDCALFLWVTPPFLLEAAKVFDAWGFNYVTKAFCWQKLTVTGKLHFGMGNWTRANSEDCLLAVRGKPKRVDASVPQIIRSRVLNHSVKPPEVRDRIVQLMGDVPRIELFARQRVAGFDAWGDDPRLREPQVQPEIKQADFGTVPVPRPLAKRTERGDK